MKFLKFQCCLFTISEFDQGGGAASAAPPMGGLGLSQRPVFQAGYGPQSLGEAYQPVGSGRGDGRDGGQMSFRQQYLEQVSKDPFWQRNLHRPILGSGFYKDPFWAEWTLHHSVKMS